MKKTKIIVFCLIFSLVFPAFAFPKKTLASDSVRPVQAVLSGKKKKYNLPLDANLYQIMFNLPDYTCQGYATLGECYNAVSIERTDQKEALAPLVAWIRKKVKKSDDQARAAASLVQNVPYDYNKSTGTEVVPSGRGHGSRYPYETLFENAGICGEKAFLMAFLFKNLGYGTAIMTFTSPALHQVAGVKCAEAYDFRDTGYCFVDPNYRHMITFGGSYESRDPYLIVPIADGKTLNAKKDFSDSRKYWTLANAVNAGTYTKKQLKAYYKLIKKYGM